MNHSAVMSSGPDGTPTLGQCDSLIATPSFKIGGVWAAAAGAAAGGFGVAHVVVTVVVTPLACALVIVVVAISVHSTS